MEMNDYISKIIDLYTKSKLEEPLKSEFHKWLVDSELSADKEDELFRLWNQTYNVATEDTLVSLTSVQAKAQFYKERKHTKLVVWRYVAAIALVIVISSAYIFTKKTSPEPNYIEYFSDSKQFGDTMILPDGSIVQANTGTVILYAESYGEKTRTVYLLGEANFKVRKNADVPFIVKSKDFSVTALGTEFDVSSYPDDSCFKTTLISGSVKVQQQGSPADYILNVNEQFVYSKQNKWRSIAQVDIYEATAWQRGELVFNGATIKEILNVLERKYA
ncbi:MAG: FecR domain-containing protein, partial [Prevotella sp.]|nr:FecR domain-containing protein [Prevotella sp.]